MPGDEGGWRVYGERAAYDDRWVGVNLVDVRAPHGERTATYAGPPSDAEEVDTEIEWVAVDRIPALVRDGRILGSSTALALLRYCTLRQERLGGGNE